ncbi:hypothetical protein [Dyadobacter sandarakinus]|uniref:Uncharacterized protein n=1 Tax=Dyadobacter sandarakinus TaxID=2747268 RepID=A0ABX7IBI0_9BACT|nr:hypothetical protein [Dyadobacter sandarakinus]QRR03459.1 hypothetical protein HWI92_22365 [Dyadobacter sandarakinus]
MKNYVFLGLASLAVLTSSCSPKASPEPVQTPVQSPQTEETPPAGTPERLLPSLLPTIAYPMFITGETEYVSKLKPEAWFSRPLEKPSLGSIAAPGKVPVMVAFGGGLTAGVSNGGLNREAQQFAYPNLVAHQMGIADFKTPLLSEAEANGTGIFLYEDPKAEYPRWKEVKNNLAKLEAGEPVKMTPYEGVVHNFAYPNGGTEGAVYYSPNWKNQVYPARFSNYNIQPPSYLLGDIQAKHNYDFVIIEEYFDDLTSNLINIARLDEKATGIPVWNEYRINPYTIEAAVNKGQKGVIFNIPHFKHLGFMNWYKAEELKKKVSSLSLVYLTPYGEKTINGSKPFFLKPTPVVEDLFWQADVNKKLEVKLVDLDVIDDSEEDIMDPSKIYNRDLQKLATQRNLALVDLYKIYERIHNGTYVTDDGLKIDGSMRGNFFSSDGIYPTPIGQAVIANEVIKAVNLKYDSKIPLINVTEFAEKVGVK